MNWTAYVMVALAVFGIIAGIVGHICYSVWWAARINTTLEFVQKTLIEIATDLKAHKLNSYTKEDAAREFQEVRSNLKAQWERIDEIKKELNEHGKKLEEHKLEFEFLKRGGNAK